MCKKKQQEKEALRCNNWVTRKDGGLNVKGEGLGLKGERRCWQN